MTSHNDDASLTEVDITDPATMQQNELIAQLIQQIAEMKVEMRKIQELANLAITANMLGPDHERLPVPFPSPDPSRQPIPISTNSPITPIQTSPVVNLPNPDAGSSNIFFQNPNNVQVGSSSQFAHTIQPQTIPPQNQAPDPYNFPSTQTVSPKMPFHIPIFSNPHDPQPAYPEIDHYKEKEKEWKAMKQFHYAPEVTGLNYEDLCIHPELSLLEGFNAFNGSGNPLAHLRAYCNQMVGVGKNEALLMRLFSQSLSGEALEWFTSQEINQWANWSAMAKDFVETFAYNVEIVPDRYSLEKVKQKFAESYREYAYRWRKNAARVRPPMTEKEIIEVFVRSQEPEFYERMMILVGAKFADIVKIGENIEDGLKTGKITRLSSLAGTSETLSKRREDVSVVSGIQDKRRTLDSHPRKSIHFEPTPLTNYQTTPHHHHPSQYLNTVQNYQYPSPSCSNVQQTYNSPSTSYPIENTRAPLPNYQTPSYPNFQVPTPRR